MSRLRRFENLEKARSSEGETARQAPSLAGRFDIPPAPVAGACPTSPDEGALRPDATGSRFAVEEAPAERIRVLDTDEGQPFVRCALCRADNYVTAPRCNQCEADLRTREQRDFNERFWRRRLEEAAEERSEVERLRRAGQQAEREAAEARRQRAALEAELDRRRALGLPLDDADDVSEPLRAAGRGIGRALGEALRRRVASRAARIGLLGTGALLGIGFLVAMPRLGFLAFWLLALVAGISRSYGRRRGRF